MTGESDFGPADVIAFWREAGPEKWFKKNADFDRAIADRFAAFMLMRRPVVSTTGPRRPKARWL